MHFIGCAYAALAKTKQICFVTTATAECQKPYKSIYLKMLANLLIDCANR